MREEFPEAIIIRPSDVISDKNQFLRHYQSKCKFIPSLLFFWIELCFCILLYAFVVIC